MASFYKTVESRSSINGTKLKNNLPYVSSGIPSLDHVIGGGLPTGAIFVVEEDVLGNYSRVLSKYFLSEGVVCKHDLFIASADDDPREFVKELPQPCTAPPEDEINIAASDVNKMKIAWRFKLDSWISSFNLTNIVICNIEDITNPKRNYDVANLKNICSHMVNDKYNGYYKIYTDGSKQNDNRGAALYDPQNFNSMKFNIDGELSIMNIELIAILEALGYIESIDHKAFVIFTDSRSSLQHLLKCTANVRGIPTAYAIIDTIFKLRDKSKLVVLQWIPSHIGVSGNELVDNLAKEASSDGVPLTVKPYFAEYIHLVKSNCHMLWKEHFDQRSVERGIWYKTIQPEPWKIPWFDNSDLCRTQLVTAFRLRSGHIPLNKFAFLMRKVQSPECSECGGLEDVCHIMMECVRNEDRRNELLLQGIDVKRHDCCNRILAFPQSREAKALYSMVILGIRRRK